jgi:hypothetical protein
MRPAAALALLALAGCAAAGAKEAPRPAADLRPRDPDVAAWHVHLDARERLLGAYTITLRFDPKVAVIESIEPCGVRHFKGSPEYDPNTFTSGMTRVTSLDAFPSRKPDNEYHLLTVTFRRVGGGTLSPTAEIERLYDADNKPIRGRIDGPPFTHSFP